jgi:hypothetical protein
MSLAARKAFPINSENDRIAALENEVMAVALQTPTKPTITPVGGAAGSQAYKIVAKIGSLFTAASAAGSTAAGPTTLSTTAYNVVSWLPVPGATSYDVYRTTGGAATGKIASVTVTPTSIPASYSINDTALVGDATTAPSFDTTGLRDPMPFSEPVQVLAGATGVITSFGLVLVTYGGVCQITLGQPVAGLPSAGGQDGARLTVVDTGGHAHTITTAVDGIATSKSVFTFGGTANYAVKLRAYNAIWYVEDLGGGALSGT